MRYSLVGVDILAQLCAVVGDFCAVNVYLHGAVVGAASIDIQADAAAVVGGGVILDVAALNHQALVGIALLTENAEISLILAVLIRQIKTRQIHTAAILGLVAGDGAVCQVGAGIARSGIIRFGIHRAAGFGSRVVA